MSRILVLFAHPALEKSRAHQQLLVGIKTLQGITVNDLYERYPEFDIDIEAEKKLLLEHDIIVWQHPFYWYSAPALLKQWLDLVLEHGWAYGKTGLALSGKKVFNAITSGGRTEGYQHDGFNKYTLQELLRPFERTAELCRMQYWPPFWVPGVHVMDSEEIHYYSDQYRELLMALRDDRISPGSIAEVSFLNSLVSVPKTN